MAGETSFREAPSWEDTGPRERLKVFHLLCELSVEAAYKVSLHQTTDDMVWKKWLTALRVVSLTKRLPSRYTTCPRGSPRARWYI